MLENRILALKIIEAIEQWYTDQGLDVPNWRSKPNDKWFRDYCKELEDDS